MFGLTYSSQLVYHVLIIKLASYIYYYFDVYKDLCSNMTMEKLKLNVVATEMCMASHSIGYVYDKLVKDINGKYPYPRIEVI